MSEGEHFKNAGLFCKRRTKFCGYIISVNEVKDGIIHAVHGNIRFANKADFSLFLNQVTASSHPIELCRILGEKTKDSVYIQDIGVFDINKGYATELMIHFITVCKENGIATIAGTLSPVDMKDHSERLCHFYEKFGFEISDTEDPFRKKILLELGSQSL